SKVYPELVTRGTGGEIQGVRYQELITLLLSEVQSQQRVLDGQARHIADLERRNESLHVALSQQDAARQALSALETRLERLEAASPRETALAARDLASMPRD